MSRMHAVELVFAIGWAAFWIYWLVAAFSMKEGTSSGPASSDQSGGPCRCRPLDPSGSLPRRRPQLGSVARWLGLVLFAFGLGFAIWARRAIGRNWGTPMSQKDEPELVTERPVPPRPPPHLLRHLGGGPRHRGGAELAVDHRCGPGRGVLRL